MISFFHVVVNIFIKREVSRDTLPESLNDEDTFEFIQLANMQKFQLVHFEHDKFYGLWSVKKQNGWKSMMSFLPV
jgi:hypothetical protein